MSVDSQHPQYTEMLPEWLRVRALTCGHREVKKTGIREALVPNPDPDDMERYKDYILRAVYVNFTGRTKVGLNGAAFRKEPTISLPAGLEYLEEDVNGKGLSLLQQIKDLEGDLFSSGREVLFVDFPHVDGEVTAAESKGLQAVILRYSAEDLINWNDDGSLAVLREHYNASDDEFKHEMKVQYRVLRMTDEGYTQQVYRQGVPFSEEVLVRDAKGSTFDRIPLVAIGSQNNDIDVDEIPLADIAHINEGHFRNSAELEENCFIHSSLTIGISTELGFEEWETANPNGVRVGSLAGVYLGPGGSFHKVQADPNNLADVLMERKEAQMVQLGARIIEKRGGQETATASKIDATGENSVLADLVGNVEHGYIKAISWCGLFMGINTTGEELEMNREFFDSSVDPQAAITAMHYFDRGLVTKKDIIQVGRKAGFVAEDTTEAELLNGMDDPGLMTNQSNTSPQDEL